MNEQDEEPRPSASSDEPPQPTATNKVPIWKYFSKVDAKSSKFLLCSKTFKTEHGSTSGIRSHLERLHHSKFVEYCKEDKLFKQLRKERPALVSKSEKIQKLDSFFKREEKYGPKHPSNIAIKTAITKWIAEGLHPFSIVDQQGFRTIMNLADKKLTVPSSTTVSRSLMPQLFVETKIKLKDIISKNDLQSISLTTDMWSSESIESYLGITIHFVGDDMDLKRFCLGCVPVQESHTGENIATYLNNTLTHWNLSSVNHMYCVTDNAANMRTAIANTDLKHILSFAHTLNLTVKDIKKNYQGFDTLIKKCRSIVGHFKHSPIAKAGLQKRQEQLGQQKLELIQDVETRWNSEYSMIERLSKLKEPLCLELTKPGCSVDNLTSSDWGMIEAYIDILKPFLDATLEVSADKKPTFGMIIPLVHGLKSGLQSVIDNKKSGITLAKCLLQSMQSRFPMVEQQQPHQLSMLLDPRFKNTILPEALKEVSKERLRRELRDLESNQRRRNLSPEPEQVDQDKPTCSKTVSSVWTAFLNATQTSDSNSKQIMAQGHLQLETYFSEPCIDILEDPLKWWAENSSRFSKLIPLVKRYIGISATEVPSERLFSSAGNIITERRRRLLPDHAEQLIFLHENLKYV